MAVACQILYLADLSVDSMLLIALVKRLCIDFTTLRYAQIRTVVRGTRRQWSIRGHRSANFAGRRDGRTRFSGLFWAFVGALAWYPNYYSDNDLLRLARRKDLKVPGNISLLPPPPRAPELSRQENVRQFMRKNWPSNRIFKSFEYIVDHCQFGLEQPS